MYFNFFDVKSSLRHAFVWNKLKTAVIHNTISQTIGAVAEKIGTFIIQFDLEKMFRTIIRKKANFDLRTGSKKLSSIINQSTLSNK